MFGIAHTDVYPPAPARLAQVDVHIDEPWNDDAPPAVRDLGRFRGLEAGAYRRHLPLGDEQVENGIQSPGRIHDPAPAEEAWTGVHPTPRRLAASAASGAPPARR